MRKLLLIGIGAGDPDLLTVQAVNALNRVDVFFIPNKGDEKADLRTVRLEICRRFATSRAHRFVEVATPPRARAPADYQSTVEAWHDRIEQAYVRLLSNQMSENECGAFLIWGDPALYDSTLRIIERMRANGFLLDYEIIPGISSIQLLAARHRIPLNLIGEPVLLTPARRIAGGFPADIDSVVVVLDGEQTFTRFDGEAFDIYWGAYLGMPDEILVAGRLSEVMGRIETIRRRARQEKGWIMDIYLLRRREPAPQ